MAPSASGGLWLGTKGGRLLREKAGRLSPVRGLSAQSPVLALCEGDAGELWIGTADGLNCLVNGRVFHWDTRNGLPSDVVAGIVEGPRKNLWLATGAGIFRISRGQIEKLISNGNMPMACQLVSPARTIPDFSMICGGRRAVISSDGLLWFATSDGVLKVDTRDPQMVPSAFPVYIESVAFNGHSPVSLLQGGSGFEPSSRDVPFQAPADLHSVEFQFTALAFAMPKDVEFRHKLEGNDSDWVDDAGARVARYGRLPYGHYVFRVQARSPQGAWQEAGNTLAFIVPAPIYFQNWALCLYVLMAMALLTGAVRMASHRRLRLRLARLEQQQTLERERMRIARDMHDEMGSKLTKISFLSECASTDAKSGKSLSEKIDSIAQTSRELLKTMDEIVWAVNPRNDNLENLANYLAHHAIEYFQNTAVECDLRLPRETPHYPLSSETRHNLFLAFEEALNNVLKHSTATRVKVEMNA
ncbi:MAG: triple tyrosine motif-containing protein, partial [Limisphaerales bacterium]